MTGAVALEDARALIERAEVAAAEAVRLLWKAGRLLAAERLATPRGEWLPRLAAAGIASQRASEAIRLAQLEAHELPATVRGALAAVATERETPDASGVSTPYACCSAAVEWYTPPRIVDAARTVLGRIDLDPATTAAANATVGAARILTADDDALHTRHRWTGRVWMNPPYSARLVGRFVDKLLDAHHCGDVPAAVVLTNAAVDTPWAQQLLTESVSVCMVAGRVRFHRADGPGPGAAPLPSMLCGLGVDPAAFAAAVGPLGTVLLTAGTVFEQSC